MASKGRYAEFQRWPAYERMYRRAFARMLKEIKARGNKIPTWKSADDVFHWYMEDRNLDGQIEIEGVRTNVS